jgi:hypothetical protein
MQKKTVLGLTVITVSILALSVFASAEIPQAFAHHRSWHDNGPISEPSGDIKASINLITCDDDAIAKWKSPAVTYQIINKAGLKQSEIDAVEAGVLDWNDLGSSVTLGVTASDADITISVYKKIVPGNILGFAVVTCDNGTDGIESVEISLGVRGLSSNGVQNLAAHEVGHGLGLGHADLNKDLMGPSLDAKERKKATCPSNLDIEGIAETTENPYEVLDWQEIPCNS